MKLSGYFVAVFTVVAAFLAALPSYGQGVVVPIICDVRPCRPPRPPRPVPQPLPNVLPVKSIKLDTKINGQVATTHVEQIFRNDTRFTLEGKYFFPIPEDASVVEFAIWENGKKLVGEVRSREEARRIYDEIVRSQRDPGLIEYAGKNLLQVSIFPIPPNSDKKLELTYTQVLKSESGTVSYKYPLGAGRNLWRGQSNANDSSRASLPPQKFGTVSGTIAISGREALRNIYSPTHNISVSNKGEKAATVTFETNGVDDDLQLFYGLSDKEVGMTLLTHREPGKDGYFLMMVSPRDNISAQKVVSKDIVFVLDTSGSMADAGKMDKARSALLFGIRTLNDGDRFNVISFAGEERLMESGLIKADQAGKKLGEAFVEKLRPTGGTNINDALLASFKQFDKNERPKMLVFMTDGLPTVGETGIEGILANLKKAKNVDVRIFPFGFGYDVNTTLLDKLGTDNGGISDYVQPKEDLEVKVSNFFSKVSSPVLSNLEIDFGRIDAEMLYPRKPGDLFNGMQLVMIGRYKNRDDLKNAEIYIKGLAGTEQRTFAYNDLDLPLRSNENEFLPRLWASRRVGWLVEEIRANGETKELKDEIVDLGTRYGLVTPYTSYLSIEGTMVNGRRNSPMMLTQMREAESKMKDSSGAGAVQMSVQQNSSKSNVMVIGRADVDEESRVVIKNSSQNQFIANKNFINDNNIWVDAEFDKDKSLPVVELKFASEEFFKVLNEIPQLAPYFSLGEEVTIVWQNKIYRVTK